MTTLESSIRSLSNGRARIRHESLKNLSEEEVTNFTSLISGMNGITSCSINPRVGSLLITWDPTQVSQEELLESARMFFPETQDSQAKTKECLVTKSLTTLSKESSKYVDGIKDSFETYGNKVLDSISPILAPDVKKGARTRRVTQNRLMLASLLASLVVLGIKGGTKMHVGLGIGFMGLLAIHLYQHKRVL